MTTDSIKLLSEKLAKAYGVDAYVKLYQDNASEQGCIAYNKLYLAEDSGRISELADENGVTVHFYKCDTAVVAYKDGLIDAAIVEFINNPSKSACARMARVRCLLAIGELK